MSVSGDTAAFDSESAGSEADEGPDWIDDDNTVCIAAPTLVPSPEGPASVVPDPEEPVVPNPEGPAVPKPEGPAPAVPDPEGPAPAVSDPEGPADVEGWEVVPGGWLKEW